MSSRLAPGSPGVTSADTVAKLREIGDWVICDYERADRIPGEVI